MNKTQQMMWDNRILHVITGSHLYGTNTPESDQDEIGIAIANQEYYLGLDSVDEADMSITSKREDGKNDKDALDLKIYEFRKFVKLAMECNPNIMELLFAPDSYIIYSNPYGAELLSKAHLFPWVGAKQKFIGYGLSQLHKAHIKIDNYVALNAAYKWLESKMYEAGRLLAEYRNETIDGIKFHEHHATIGDLNISLTDKLTKVFNKVAGRLSKVGNREELYTKYGADTKFLFHACRLLLEGKELLTTGAIQFPLKEKDFLLDIRNGKYKQQEIIDYAHGLIKELDSPELKIVVPSKPRYNEINQFLISMVSNYHVRI